MTVSHQPEDLVDRPAIPVLPGLNGGFLVHRFLLLNLGQPQADREELVTLLGCVLVTDAQRC